MPSIPPPSAAIQDTVNTVLNSVRHRLNGRLPTLFPVSGKVLGTEDAFTQQCFNDGYRRFQEKLADLGHTLLKQEAILTGVPATTNQDPASQQYVDWFTFFDGTNFQSTPVLPSNFVHPLKVWERWTGSGLPFPNEPMECVLDGMPTNQKTNFNGIWEWRDNKVFLPGSLMSMDLRFLYVQYLPDFVNVGTTRWFQQKIPIVRSLEALSRFVVCEFLNARTPANDAEAAEQMNVAASFQEEAAQEATKLVFNRDVKMKQRVTVSRQPRSGRGGGNSYWAGGYGIE